MRTTLILSVHLVMLVQAYLTALRAQEAQAARPTPEGPAGGPQKKSALIEAALLAGPN